MATMTMERLEEIAAAWRRGLDADELTNPAGPLFTDETYVDYDITATGDPAPLTYGTAQSIVHMPPIGKCFCCPF